MRALFLASRPCGGEKKAPSGASGEVENIVHGLSPLILPISNYRCGSEMQVIIRSTFSEET